MSAFIERALDVYAKPASWESPRAFLRLLAALCCLPLLFLYRLAVPGK